jgi:hypothetical protein
LGEEKAEESERTRGGKHHRDPSWWEYKPERFVRDLINLFRYTPALKMYGGKTPEQHHDKRIAYSLRRRDELTGEQKKFIAERSQRYLDVALTMPEDSCQTKAT